MELPVTALCRPLVTEHWADVPEPLGPGVVQRVLDRRPHDPGPRLGAERQMLAVQLVDEAVHLLLDDVRGFPDRATEERGRLEERGADVAVAVAPRPRAHGLLEALPQRGLVGQDVVHPPDRLDGLGHRLSWAVLGDGLGRLFVVSALAPALPAR